MTSYERKRAEALLLEELPPDELIEVNVEFESGGGAPIRTFTARKERRRAITPLPSDLPAPAAPGTAKTAPRRKAD